MNHEPPEQPVPDPVKLGQYLDHLLQQERFRKSPSLRQLMEYLVRKTADSRVDDIKESTIAVDVFGRSPEFDGRLDNIVRVQAHRLRKLLDAYYENEGASDPFHIAIPKGTYIPSIRSREETAKPAATEVPGEVIPAAPPVEVMPAGTAPAKSRPNRHGWQALVAAFVAGLICCAAFLWAARPGWILGARTTISDNDARKPPLATLWGSLLQPGVNCIVSFTNPAFLWTRMPRHRIFLSYYGPVSAPVGSPVEPAAAEANVDPALLKEGRAFFFSDNWTGTGEVFGIYRLTRLFTAAGRPLKIVRSRALSFADLRDTNVVFVGSPWANEMQDKINPGQTPLACLNSGRITNSQPQAGEAASYERVYDPHTKALAASYALLSVLPGVTPGTKTISSAGLDTYGTAAGIDFLTSEAGVSQLLDRFDPERKQKLPEFFQAVIRTEIVRGDPARWELILVRALDWKALSQPEKRAQ